MEKKRPARGGPAEMASSRNSIPPRVYFPEHNFCQICGVPFRPARNYHYLCVTCFRGSQLGRTIGRYAEYLREGVR